MVNASMIAGAMRSANYKKNCQPRVTNLVKVGILWLDYHVEMDRRGNMKDGAVDSSSS